MITWIVVLFLLLAPLHSQAELFGSWMTGSSDDGSTRYAVTINESGSILGEYCATDDGTCFWILGTDTACEPETTTPIIANSDRGAVHLMLECDQQVKTDAYRYLFGDFDAIRSSVTNGATRIGFALPLKSDTFKVVRFDLTGVVEALEKLRRDIEQVQRQKKTPPLPRGKKDTYL